MVMTTRPRHRPGLSCRGRGTSPHSRYHANLAISTNLWYLKFMSKNTSFSVGEHFADFIQTQVGAGRYASASDVVRAGLRLLEDQEARVAALRAALAEGEESGASARSVQDIWSAVKERTGISGA